MNNIRDLRNQNKALRLLREYAKDVEEHLMAQIADAYPRKRKNVVYPVRLRNRYLNILWKLFLFWMEEGRKLAIQKIDDAIYRLNVRELTDEQLLQKAVFQKRAEYDKWVKRHLVSLEKKRFKDTVRRAQKSIGIGIEKGLSATQVQDLLRKQFRKYSEAELNRVVTTEYTRAVNLGQIREYNADPVIVGYQPRVNYKGCPICDAIEAEGMVPKDEIRDFPPYHPWCQCTIEPVFPWDKEAEGLILIGPPEGYLPETPYMPKYIDPTLPIEQQVLQAMQYRWKKSSYEELTDKDMKNLKWMWRYVFKQKGPLPDLKDVPVPKLKKTRKVTRKPKPLPKKETEPVEKQFEPPPQPKPLPKSGSFWEVDDGDDHVRHQALKEKLKKYFDDNGFWTSSDRHHQEFLIRRFIFRTDDVKDLANLHPTTGSKSGIKEYAAQKTKSYTNQFKRAWNDCIGRIASDDVHEFYDRSPIRLMISNTPGRANATPWRETVMGEGRRHILRFFYGNSQSTTVHEFGHILEWNRSVRRKAFKFRQRRAVKDPTGRPTTIDITPHGSSKTEYAYECNFPSKYCGRKYDSFKFHEWDGEATEITSMGMQYLKDMDSAVRFARQDFDYFTFMVGILQGAI